MLLNKLKKHWLAAILIFALANVVLFWKFYFQGLYPFPGDLLVSFFFPWNSGGFPGFNPWTTHKEYVAADVIRQMYPWKTVAIDLLKNGHWPLWNPYNFSGTPLLANLQSSIFFPTTVLFFFLPAIIAWTLPVIFLPSLFGLFTYFFLRSLKISFWASIFGGLASINLAYPLIWTELVVFWQTLLFLPLMLLVINRSSQRKTGLMLLPVFIALTIFGGHIQTAAYVFVIVFAYSLFKKVPVLKIVLLFGLGFLIASVQLLPSAELYFNSAREGASTNALFPQTITPIKYLLTLFTPDFFGNVATNNYWGEDYNNFQVYFGLTTLIFSLFSFSVWKKSSEVKFFIILALFGLIFAMTPLALVPFILKIPIFSSSNASRAIFLTMYSGAILGAMGFDSWLENQKGRAINLIYLLGIVLFLAAGSTLLIHSGNLLVTRNNLILPVFIFLTTLFVIKIRRPGLRLIVIGLLLLETTYFFNKFQPFAPAKFIFPQHPILNFLRENAGQDRFFGLGSAYLDTNFATFYHLFAPEGYDSLYIKRYGELLSSTANGSIAPEIPRSDASVIKQDNVYRSRLFDILAVKYILTKEELQPLSPDNYQPIWQDLKSKIYQRKSALPRVFLADRYEVISDKNEIIARFYQKNFDYQNTVILETEPNFKTGSSSGETKIVDYQSDKVIISSKSNDSKILFLSDSYYPGWKASVDGKEVPIFRADYSFRAVPVEAGDHLITFQYDPISFKIGAGLTILGLLFSLLWLRKSFRT